MLRDIKFHGVTCIYSSCNISISVCTATPFVNIARLNTVWGGYGEEIGRGCLESTGILIFKHHRLWWSVRVFQFKDYVLLLIYTVVSGVIHNVQSSCSTIFLNDSNVDCLSFYYILHHVSDKSLEGRNNEKLATTVDIWIKFQSNSRMQS